ncbi:687_t:CDS:2 [Entrophospora sp. SA101]|nr:687_t:CDS:2 [Entrophospora sp. SA101]
MYYRGANAAILVYDITSEESFLDMNSWIEAPDRRVIPLKRTQDYVSRILGNNFSVHEASAKDDKDFLETKKCIDDTFLQRFIPVYGPFFDYDREGCGNYDNIDRGFDYKAGWERSREKTMV